MGNHATDRVPIRPMEVPRDLPSCASLVDACALLAGEMCTRPSMPGDEEPAAPTSPWSARFAATHARSSEHTLRVTTSASCCAVWGISIEDPSGILIVVSAQSACW